MYVLSILFFVLLVQELEGFQRLADRALRVSAPLRSTWQEDLDQILDIDTSCDSRKEISRSLIKKYNEISTDVVSAVRERSVSRLAPRSLSYGKALRGIRSFKNQIFTDIIPDILTKSIPKVVEEGPKIVGKILETRPTEVLETGQKVVSQARDIMQDPSMLQSTVDDLRKELRKVVKSTPDGLQTPYYDVLEANEACEIRKYVPYSICTTPLQAGLLFTADSPIEALVLSESYKKLISYISGSNSRDGLSEKLARTIPIITDATTMSFVLPDGINSFTAPIPDSMDIVLKDLPAQTLAVREFTGLATEGEINRQRARLEDYLISNGIEYDSDSFKVFQYNPLYTLPWVRRNEISFMMMRPTNAVNRSKTADESKFFAAPEAGD